MTENNYKTTQTAMDGFQKTFTKMISDLESMKQTRKQNFRFLAKFNDIDRKLPVERQKAIEESMDTIKQEMQITNQNIDFLKQQNDEITNKKNTLKNNQITSQEEAEDIAFMLSNIKNKLQDQESKMDRSLETKIDKANQVTQLLKKYYPQEIETKKLKKEFNFTKNNVIKIMSKISKKISSLLKNTANKIKNTAKSMANNNNVINKSMEEGSKKNRTKVKNITKKFNNAAKEVANKTVNSLKNTTQGVINSINSDAEYNPKAFAKEMERTRKQKQNTSNQLQGTSKQSPGLIENTVTKIKDKANMLFNTLFKKSERTNNKSEAQAGNTHISVQTTSNIRQFTPPNTLNNKKQSSKQNHR